MQGYAAKPFRSRWSISLATTNMKVLSYLLNLGENSLFFYFVFLRRMGVCVLTVRFEPLEKREGQLLL